MSKADDIRRKAADINKSKDDEYIYNILIFMANKIAEVTNGKNVVLKGGLALMDRINAIDPSYFRMTRDIDLSIADEYTYDIIFSNILNIFNDNNLGLTFEIEKHRGRKGTGEGYDFNVKLINGSTYNVGIDMQVAQNGVIRAVQGYKLNIGVYDSYTMLADKISAVCSRKIFRRVKDIYDIYVLTKIQDYDMNLLINVLVNKRPEFVNDKICMFRADTVEQLYHAYNSFTGIKNKPEFRVVYSITSNFVIPVINAIDTGNCSHIWKAGGSNWV